MIRRHYAADVFAALMHDFRDSAIDGFRQLPAPERRQRRWLPLRIIGWPAAADDTADIIDAARLPPAADGDAELSWLR